LDYLKDLGVDVVWVSPSTYRGEPTYNASELTNRPVYRSPQADMGYDIADYRDIDPRYGSLQDVDELIAGLKTRNMRLMMDLVVNHTSNQVRSTVITQG
jgi:oligo-1,6-glucosidase